MPKDDTTAGILNRLLGSTADQIDWSKARKILHVSSREEAVQMLATALAGARAELSQEKAELGLLVQAGSEHALLTLDEAGNIIAASPESARILGWRLEDMLGNPVDRILEHRQAGEQTSSDEMQNAAGGEEVVSERTHERSDGTTFKGQHTLLALIGPDGNVSGLVRKIEDVTSQRAHEIHIDELDARIALLIG